MGTPTTSTDQMEMTFDPNSGSFSGTNSTLSISGSLNGSAVTGVATLNGRAGNFEGVIGTNGTVGSFWGDDSEFINNQGYVFSGGFVGVPK